MRNDTVSAAATGLPLTARRHVLTTMLAASAVASAASLPGCSSLSSPAAASIVKAAPYIPGCQPDAGSDYCDANSKARAARPALAASTELSSLSISDLDALYEALLAAGDAFALYANQPRVECPGELHTLLSRRYEALESEMSAVIRELETREPSDWWPRQLRAQRLITHACRCGEGLADISTLAANLAMADRQ